MSEAMMLPPLEEAAEKRVPTVYFIDDSATMREVIKIAFRRENIHVITCADAASALAQFEQTRPDVVITDVIMPDQDGYSVCSRIKENPDLSATPVLLMSGVVNKSVADKAVSVEADELIRKPFQPQELIHRVKALLEPKSPAPAPTTERGAATSALSSLFAPAPAAPRSVAPPPAPQAPQEPAWPRALAEAFSPRPPQPRQSNYRSHLWQPLPGRLPPLTNSLGFAWKLPGWNCSSKSFRPNCKSSANITRRWKHRSAPSPKSNKQSFLWQLFAGAHHAAPLFC